jgi:hypothetical protein
LEAIPACKHPHPHAATLRRPPKPQPPLEASVGGGLAEAATGPSVPPPLSDVFTQRREAAKRGLGASASCWQCSAKARSSQQGASAPRPHFASPRGSRGGTAVPAGSLHGVVPRWYACSRGRGAGGATGLSEASSNGGGAEGVDGPLEVGSRTPRGGASREALERRRRDRAVPSRSQRGRLQRCQLGCLTGTARGPRAPGARR